QQRAGVFVAAMLAPHHRKDAQLGVARLASEDFPGVGVFVRCQVVFGNQLRRDGGFGHGVEFVVLKTPDGMIEAEAATLVKTVAFNCSATNRVKARRRSSLTCVRSM